MYPPKIMHIQTKTFIGHGDGLIVLVVEPLYNVEPAHGVRTTPNDYEIDADKIADFLRSIFCTATLNALKEKL